MPSTDLSEIHTAASRSPVARKSFSLWSRRFARRSVDPSVRRLSATARSETVPPHERLVPPPCTAVSLATVLTWTAMVTVLPASHTATDDRGLAPECVIAGPERDTVTDGRGLPMINYQIQLKPAHASSTFLPANVIR